jgi:hypothetical protein
MFSAEKADPLLAEMFEALCQQRRILAVPTYQRIVVSELNLSEGVLRIKDANVL